MREKRIRKYRCARNKAISNSSLSPGEFEGALKALNAASPSFISGV